MDADTLQAAVQPLMQAEKYGQARELMLANEPLTRSCARLSWNMGWSAFKLDQLEEAQTWLEHAVEQNPAHPATRWALGHVHMAQNSFDSAEREFLRSIALKDSYRARQALGFLYHRSGKLDEARAVYMEGLRLRPDDPKRHEAYADFLSDVGLNAEATEYYERAKELPHDDDG